MKKPSDFSLSDTMLPVVELASGDPVSLTPGTFAHAARVGIGKDLFPLSKTEVLRFL